MFKNLKQYILFMLAYESIYINQLSIKSQVAYRENVVINISELTKYINNRNVQQS